MTLPLEKCCSCNVGRRSRNGNLHGTLMDHECDKALGFRGVLNERRALISWQKDIDPFSQSELVLADVFMTRVDTAHPPQKIEIKNKAHAHPSFPSACSLQQKF